MTINFIDRNGFTRRLYKSAAGKVWLSVAGKPNTSIMVDPEIFDRAIAAGLS